MKKNSYLPRILVSGATGYIGSHVVKFLGGLGYEIDMISKEEMSEQEDFSRLDHFQLNKKQGSPDVVVHCAWIREQDLDSMHHYEMAELSCHFFNECAKRGIRVINLGSSSEYGMQFEPMNEDTTVCRPHTMYGIAKWMVTMHAKRLGFNTLRLFAVYGDGGHSFRDHLDSEKFADGRDVRHWVYIETVCKAIERLLHSKHLYEEIINIAEKYENYFDVFDHENAEKPDPLNAFKVHRKYEQEVQWRSYPQRQFEPSRWEADTSKMHKLLNL